METNTEHLIVIVEGGGGVAEAVAELLAQGGAAAQLRSAIGDRGSGSGFDPELLVYVRGEAGTRAAPLDILRGQACAAEVPVLLITDCQKPVDRDLGYAEGFSDVVAWPCGAAELAFRASALVEAHRLRRRIAGLEGRLASEMEDSRRAVEAFRLNEERLDALLKLSEMRDSSEAELSHFAIDECVRLTGSQIGYLHFVDESETGFLSYVWSKGSREVCRAADYMDYGLASAGIWADTLRFKRPVIHNDYPNEATRRGLPEGHLPLLRHMGVPVLKGSRVVAVSGVANKEDDYDLADLRQLVLFSSRLWSIVEAKRSESELARANAELSKLAVLDGLTGLSNRRAFDEFLRRQWRLASREGKPISLLMADIDSFKAYNDRYGHLAGDEALKRVAATIAEAARRPDDLAARYGGEEFVVVLPCTELADALRIGVATVLRTRLLGIPHERSAAAEIVTVSIGVASLVPPRGVESSPESLLAAADAALYEAKRGGKDRASLGRPA